MRLATLRTHAGTQAVRVESATRATLLDAPDVGALLNTDKWKTLACADGDTIGFGSADLAPVVTLPSAKIFLVGFNFASHAAELGRAQPDFPSIFAKYPESLIGANDPISLPHSSLSVSNDWEVELVAVIGKAGRHIPVDRADNHIAGYCVGNDTGVRDWQFRNRPPLMGKIWEAMTPVGPWLTTDVTSIPELRLTTDVDGVRVQDGIGADMIFSPATVVSYISTAITLRPGDMIFLGTPPGIAMGQTPEPWLRPGQVLTTSISGLGELRNTCVEAPAPTTTDWTVR
ncbi:fumarylacetoacetate hydrolase family protein [Nocardia nova SH22a]|uniref:Fumarylacetoacetate hydrolase family protein n=1 Tax=Nocardia nova SH22a TaxID=1415166 RepID=W5TRS2_9NOCA|nr:fumarylacetoacetate hydrolase family protein [Nocardia nova]AHH19916.1 fumarylacetoacetate hydrolase family protein [Nocardia nova SH22a]